ncbi:MAG: phosphoenolpyruvate carboxykinase (ATP), partial [Gemmatimonadaceae bacterium]
MATEMKPQALSGQGLHPAGDVHWNLIGAELMLAAARRGEGEFAEMGPFVARTAPHTGRSPNDKFVVRDPASEKDVDWGKVNQPITPNHFAALLADVRKYLDAAPELFVQDLHCGADPAYQLSVRYVSPNAWHMAFVRNMFIRPEAEALAG